MTLGDHGARRNVHPLGAHMVFHSTAGRYLPLAAATATKNSSALKKMHDTDHACE